jgi:hypothetical protein
MRPARAQLALSEPTSVPPTPPPAPPIAPTFRNSWPLFVWLIATAVVMYYAKWPILVILAVVLIVRGLSWLGHRYPKTTLFILLFLRSLLRR